MVTGLNLQKEEEGLQETNEERESLTKEKFSVLIATSGAILLMNIGIARVSRKKKEVMMMKRHMWLKRIQIQNRYY